MLGSDLSTPSWTCSSPFLTLRLNTLFTQEKEKKSGYNQFTELMTKAQMLRHS